MKRKRGPSSYHTARPYKVRRTSAYGGQRLAVMRTGGNYSQIYRRRMANGAYRTGPGPERKFIDTIISSNEEYGAISFELGVPAYTFPGEATVSNAVLMNGLPQGTDSTQRIGRKIMMKSIQANIEVTLQSESTMTVGTPISGVTPGTVRCLVVYDSQANGAAPDITDILQLGSIGSLVSPMNLNNRERFKIIWDKRRHIDPQGPGTIHFHLYKKCGLPVVFNGGNAGTIADIQTGSVYIFLITDVQATAANTMGALAYTRIRFLDD